MSRQDITKVIYLRPVQSDYCANMNQILVYFSLIANYKVYNSIHICGPYISNQILADSAVDLVSNAHFVLCNSNITLSPMGTYPI